MPKDILSLRNVPPNSTYYKTLDNSDFIIYRDNSMIILQSPSLAKIQMKLWLIIFWDTTFFVVSNFAYQLFITMYILQQLIVIILHLLQIWIVKKKNNIKKFLRKFMLISNII